MVPPASHRISRARWYSGYCQLCQNFAYETITLYGLPSQTVLLSRRLLYTVRNPTGIATHGLASFPFARRYSENRCFFLFLRLLRCFSSAGSLRKAMDSPYDDSVLRCRVAPFGNPRLKGYLRLPVAYRSLSRPSSAPDAKAFTLCSCSLIRSNHMSSLFCFTLIRKNFIYSHCSVFKVHAFAFRLVGLGGLEPPTSRLSGVRSNLLSYRPLSSLFWFCLVEMRRLELLTSCVQSRRSPS